MKCLVAVVIPVYKKTPCELERISLLQVKSVLGHHELMLLAPDNLDTAEYELLGINKVIRLSPKWFSSVEMYSRMCLDKGFYELFLQYEYILIYQLDAFVFSDRLNEYCDKGYDYVGAPVPKVCWDGVPFYVGNGGFSLRRVAKCLEMTQRRDDILKKFREEFGDSIADEIVNREDCFFAFCGYRGDISFKVPGMDEAFDFSVEFNINGIYSRVCERLPFGCHRWPVYRFKEWWEIISNYGYSISSDVYDEHCSFFQWHEYAVLMSVLERTEFVDRFKKVLKNYTKNGEISIWGYGKNGETIVRFLKMCEIKVATIFDSAFDDRSIFEPTKSRIMKHKIPILVTSIKYEHEIENQLKALRKQRDVDYYTWKDLSVDLGKELGIYTVGEKI